MPHYNFYNPDDERYAYREHLDELSRDELHEFREEQESRDRLEGDQLEYRNLTTEGVCLKRKDK